ncbi:hypothetical protein FB45DRAFT_890776 [Roridomyces roridus]|uniref:F-box domain-containing protein n=1 Tax=Roridomyces roridus TaxID=1738132 RepID=A0AAD7CDX3_9AGAR|nr:hypothetical protein FB45DRAFT_890776 [Roridomyces roridus]
MFVACLPTHRNAVMSAQEAPLLVSRICSAWRVIALTTPSLWASLHIPGYFILKRPEQRIPAMTRWLQLSGVLPISLSFELLDRSVPPRPFEDFETLCLLMDALAESASRWDNLVVQNLVTTVPLGFANAEAAILKSFEGEGVTLSVLRQLDVLLRTSSLRTLILLLDSLQPGFDGSSDLLDLPCHWENLTHMTLKPRHCHGGLPLSRVLTLLQRCPRLVSFHVTPNDDNTPDWDRYATSIPLPVLESLILFEPAALDLKSVSPLLDTLFLPKLRQLHIPTTSYSSAQLDQHQLFPDLSMALEDLLIYLPSYTAPMILQALGAFSNLTTLTIQTGYQRQWQWESGAHDADVEPCSPEHLLELLTPSPEMVLCPKLQSLELGDRGPVLKGTLEQFIWGRIDLRVGFRRLAILRDGQNRQLSQEFSVDETQMFRSQGVEVSLPISLSNHGAWGQPTPWTSLSDGWPSGQ